MEEPGVCVHAKSKIASPVMDKIVDADICVVCVRFILSSLN